MINIWIVLGILFFHWLFDFVFQTEEQASEKSKNWSDLLAHTGIYSTCWFVLSIIICCIPGFSDNLLWFSFVTFVCHTATDYYTSKVNSQLLKQKNVHGFFVSIGFDQYLHYIQLLLTYYFLTK